jgi:hypothetical protein
MEWSRGRQLKATPDGGCLRTGSNRRTRLEAYPNAVAPIPDRLDRWVERFDGFEHGSALCFLEPLVARGRLRSLHRQLRGSHGSREAEDRSECEHGG